MNFDEFIEKVVEMVKEKMGETCTIKVDSVTKNNAVHLKGITFIKQDGNVFPTVYLNEPYQRYQYGVTLQKIVEEIISMYRSSPLGKSLNMDYFADFSKVEGRIFYKVINLEKNRELLQNVPYIRWHDLAITFYYFMEKTILGKSVIMIRNSHLVMWGKSVDEIYRIAQQNTKEKMPEILMPIHEMMGEMEGWKIGGGIIPLYVLTNKEQMLGASAMLYSEKMKKLADDLESDLLILPSSIHEVILVPEQGEQDSDFYRMIVSGINISQVAPDEILSFNIYRYNRKKKEIKMTGV